MTCATILNAMLMVHSKEKKPKWYTADDFIPKYGEEIQGKEQESKTQSVDEMKELLKQLAGI